VKANQLFSWRKLYLAGELEVGAANIASVRLLPVAITEKEQPVELPSEPSAASRNITTNIELPVQTLVSEEGHVDLEIIRAVLERLWG
jgi:hypothetical protein